MTSRYQDPRPQYLDQSGNPLPNAELNFYNVGTLTRKNTYKDPELTILNSNPVSLNADGTVPNVFYLGSARVILTWDDGSGSQTRFDVDNVGVIGSGTTFDQFSTAIEYEKGAIIQGSDANYYRSLANGNKGNDPITNPANWERVDFLQYWNATITYTQGQLVVGSDGKLYGSLQNGNLNKNPTTETAWWSDSQSIFDQVLDSTSDVTFNTVTVASGGVSTQWDQAYGWGDHAGLYQPLDADLTSIASLTGAANKMLYATGASTWALADLTAAGRALLDDADTSAQRTTLGLGAMAVLGSINNTNWSGADLAIANGGTGASTAAAARTNLEVARLGYLKLNATTSTHTTCFIPFVRDASTSEQVVEIDSSQLLYNASTGLLTAVDVTGTSDIRKKKNVVDMEVNWDRFMKYRPVLHEWNDGREGVFPAFIAQEVQEIDPSLVAIEDTEDKFLSVNYSKMAPEHALLIQDLHRRVLELENKK